MSSSIYYAANSAIGFGAEVTYGTAVARTVWLYPTNCTLRPNMVRQNRDFTRSSATSFNDFDDYVAFRGWSGNITCELTYDNCGLLLRQCLGAATTTGPVGSIYTHLYKQALAYPVGLTIEVNRGVTAKDLYQGGKVMRWSISQDVSSGKPVILSMDLIGTLHTRSDSPAGITARTNETLMHYNHQTGTTQNLQWNAISVPWKRWELSMDNGLAERRFNGSLYTQEPLRNTRNNIQWTFVTDVYDTLMDGYEAGTQASLTMIYDDPSSLKTMQFQSANAKIVDITDSQISGGSPGIFETTTTFKTFTDGTNDGISVTVETLTATAIGQG